jgi:hypothetical protein
MLQSRFVVKYRNKDGRLSAKATDDHKTVKFDTNQQEHLRLVDKLSLWCAQEVLSSSTPAAASSGSAAKGGSTAPAKDAEALKAEIERKKKRNEEYARKRRATANSKSLEKDGDKTLGQRKREQAKRDKKAKKWAARQERKLLRTASAVAAAGAGKA